MPPTPPLQSVCYTLNGTVEMMSTRSAETKPWPWRGWFKMEGEDIDQAGFFTRSLRPIQDKNIAKTFH